MKLETLDNHKAVQDAGGHAVKSCGRIDSIDSLRGIAALGVCYFHLTLSLSNSWVKASGSYGGLGVQIFFVISGFVIPYSLYRSGYDIRSYGVFIIKRIVRVDPPYLVVIALIIPLGYLCAMMPGFKGPSYDVSVKQVVLHFAYLNAFFKENWLNPVFWTLAIEFQYYLLVGLLFPLIAHKKLAVRGCFFALIGVIAVCFASDDYRQVVVHWFFLFMLGMVVFQRMVGLTNVWQFSIFFFILIFGTYYTLGTLDAVVGGLTSLAIIFLKIRNRFILFLGTISYSLYLIHNPTGVKLVNLGSRFESNWIGQIIVLFAGIALSIAAAFILCRFVERPAQKWASGFAYRNKPSIRPIIN